MQVTVCGGGNAAHTAIGLLSSHNDLVVNGYLSFSHEASQWKDGIASQGGIQVIQADRVVLGRPSRISTDPEEVIPGSKLVLLALPAFAHETVLRSIAPHLDEGAWVGAFPARSCFDLCADEALEGRMESAAIFGLQTLPWACRVQNFGQQVRVLGTKKQVEMAAWPNSAADPIADFLSDRFGLSVLTIDNFLSLTLAGTGQLIHPGIMYGLFHDWDGILFKQAPFFYQGVDSATADLLQALSDEVQMVRVALEGHFPALDLSAVRSLGDWLWRSYQEDILDNSTLQTAFNTNRSYAGLTAPVRSVDSGFEPDFQSRYLSEDIPYGLLATMGIARLVEVPVPRMQEVVQWAQDRLGKEYLINGELRGRDLLATRAPQRYGFHTIDRLLGSVRM